MPPKKTPNPAAAARRDLDELLTAIFDKLETDDPAWAAGLTLAQKAARSRVTARAARRIDNP